MPRPTNRRRVSQTDLLRYLIQKYDIRCDRCGATQGDFYLNEDFTDLLKEEFPRDFELILINDGTLERRFRSVSEASAYFQSRNS